MIELSDFTKVYQTGFSGKKERAAVSHFSMTCTPGTVTALLGANGAGKTTILKAVCAYHFATSGHVIVENHDAAEDPSFVKDCTGFVEEQSILPPEYTVREFISFAAQLHGLDKPSCKSAFDRVVNDCMLEDVLAKKIKTLSKGYKQRVSFAKALIADPPVLVLDEPTSGLDPAQIVRMRSLVLSLSAGRTVLLSTHLMQEVDALCSQIYIVSHGVCAAHGTASQIMAQTHTSSLEKAFLSVTDSVQKDGEADK